MVRRIAVTALSFIAVALAACGGSTGGGASGVVPAIGGYGGRLQSGANFTVLLFVLGEKAQTVDYVGVSCAPQGTIAGGPFTVAENVAIEEGTFRAESPDVTVEGRFASSTRAEGTARARTPDAEGCGIGDEAAWVSECDLSVTTEEQEATGGLVIGGSSGTTDGGTAYATVEVVTKDDQRLVGELLDSGSCASA